MFTCTSKQAERRTQRRNLESEFRGDFSMGIQRGIQRLQRKNSDRILQNRMIFQKRNSEEKFRGGSNEFEFRKIRRRFNLHSSRESKKSSDKFPRFSAARHSVRNLEEISGNKFQRSHSRNSEEGKR